MRPGAREAGRGMDGGDGIERGREQVRWVLWGVERGEGTTHEKATSWSWYLSIARLNATCMRGPTHTQRGTRAHKVCAEKCTSQA
jgi:hypothetical protein